MRRIDSWTALLIIAALAALAAACGGGDGDADEPAATTEDAGARAGLTPEEDSPTVLATSLKLAVGEEGDVQVEAIDFPAPGIGAWTVDIDYDPEVASVVECEATLQLGVCNPDFTDRLVRVTGATAQAPSGDTVIARVRLRCEAAGETTLTVSIETLADGTVGNPQELAAHIQNGTLTCT